MIFYKNCGIIYTVFVYFKISKMHFHIITLFTEIFDSYLNESILGRAIEDRKIKISFYNPRDFSNINGNNKFKHIDQKPYGCELIVTGKQIGRAHV